MALEHVPATIVSWLLTYGVHSTLILGGAWLLLRVRPFRAPAARDRVWKLALVGRHRHGDAPGDQRPSHP